MFFNKPEQSASNFDIVTKSILAGAGVGAGVVVGMSIGSRTSELLGMIIDPITGVVVDSCDYVAGKVLGVFMKDPSADPSADPKA